MQNDLEGMRKEAVVTEFEILSREFAISDVGKRRKTFCEITSFKTDFEPITPNFVI